MKKRLTVFSVCSLILAVLIFGFSYVLFHYASPEGGFSSVWRAEPSKPLVTELFAILGVLFLFTGLAALLGRLVFFNRCGKGE